MKIALTCVVSICTLSVTLSNSLLHWASCSCKAISWWKLLWHVCLCIYGFLWLYPIVYQTEPLCSCKAISQWNCLNVCYLYKYALSVTLSNCFFGVSLFALTRQSADEYFFSCCHYKYELSVTLSNSFSARGELVILSSGVVKLVFRVLPKS